MRHPAALLILATIGASAQSLDRLKPLIVMINGETQGAGIVFRLDDNRRAWILTAHHVVAEKKSLTVRFFGKDDPVKATLRSEASVDDDVAVLTAPAPPNYTFPFHLTGPTGAVGQPVRALGNPAGEPWQQTFQASTIARVGSSHLHVESPVITNGYSGGALANSEGRLIGMILNTNGVTATVLRLDRALEILRRDLRLTIQLGIAPFPGATRTNPKDGLAYRWIPPGEFTMGCSPGDNQCDFDEKPPRSATIPRGFWFGETEVTQAAYEAVMGANPRFFKGPQRPVDSVDWSQASSYCQAVGLRLPTEVEWEYAARAGSTAARYGELADIAATGKATNTVGRKAANAWGLRDTLGNVWEWTSDRYEPGNRRVLRGGAVGNDPPFIRVSARLEFGPTVRNSNLGFRCAGELR